MTRMWMVDPVYMCREHLLGEHSELHQLVGTIRNHDHGEAIVEGHADEGNVDTTKINHRHIILVAEMNRRGMDHDSPLFYEPDEPEIGRGSISERKNIEDLYTRCEDCRERIEDRYGEIDV